MRPPLYFRDFELRPDERRLVLQGGPVHIGARAYDLLMALVDRSDRVVGKNELLDIVWPRLVVEENNLQVHISALRKLLGPGAITTVPGRGYRFTAEPAVATTPPRRRRQDTSPGTAEAVSAGGAAGNLPECLPALYGRAHDLLAVRELLETQRLVTITGAGGIGKTCLAQALAHEQRARYPQGAWMIELAWVHDEALLVSLVAQTLGVTLAARKSAVDELCEALRPQNLLLVLDNCEQLVDAVGSLAFQLLRNAPSVRVLTTSQELLRVAGEHVYKLAPLAVPTDRNPQHAAGFGAVQLFVERARALDRRFELDERNIDAVVEICTKLDGIALAIELAAARVPLLGVYGIHDRLGERFRVLTGGARVSLRRHQTLRAALDWSHHLLNAEEQTVFRRLGLFSGGFAVEGAQGVASDPEIDEWAVLDHLSALVDKSLVLVDGSEHPRYRLLETSRAYAMEKLAEAGETDAWMRRHAEVTCSLCERAVRERDDDGLLADMNNVRAAYAWATGSGGDDVIAIRLATSSAMVLAVAGLVNEAMQRLLEVEPLVTSATPATLAAQFWQWLGRCGIGGRLPTSRCVGALQRAETMFRALQNKRHLHACLRMRAEALLATDDHGAAQAALLEAEAMEHHGWPVADSMRRLRVQGLLHAAAGRYEESLATSQQAFDMAQAAGIERYVLILLADLAGVQLKMGRATQAARQFRALADKTAHRRSEGLTLSHALAGLTAALIAQEQYTEAATVSAQALPLLRRCGLFVAHCDIYAWLLACRGQLQVAARLMGAADAFHKHSETSRDEIRRRARQEVLHLLEAGPARGQVQRWTVEGAVATEEALARMVDGGLSAAGGAAVAMAQAATTLTGKTSVA